MKKYLLALIIILLFIAHSMTAEACQEIGAKELKSFKDKTGVDLSQALTFAMTSQMTPPPEVADQWNNQQKRKWQILVPTTKINEVKVTDYRIFACHNNISAFYPCNKTLYQLRLQLNPQESCKSVDNEDMNIAVLALVENKTLKILDFLFENNPSSHQMTPLGLLVLEDIDLAKKEAVKAR